MNIRMSTKGKRPLRSLTPSDKIHAIQRIHDGESKASVARDIGVPESTLRGWCKNEDKLRFMSRQTATDAMTNDSLTEKSDGSAIMLGGPPEKRVKLDAALPLNFSNKLKFGDMAFNRSPLNGLDYTTNKTLSDLTFNGLAQDYAAFNGAMKSKVFGADISRQADPSMAAISPLSSLTHLSGLTGISQSPLAISFNELTSNLNLLAQLNPGLAAMSGLNGLTANANTLRNVKPKAQPQLNSPRSECSDRQQTGISVKTWAKQKTPISTGNDSNYGLNLSHTETKNKMKCPSPSLAPSLGGSLPPIPAMPDDPLLYWLKSQQQIMLSLNNLYPHSSAMNASSPPIRSSTPQQISHHANTPPVAIAPFTPSTTPSGSLDDKNANWFNWCKAFNASLNSLAPAAAAAALHANQLQQPPTGNAIEGSHAISNATQPTSIQKSPLENILYSQLTKESVSPSVLSASSADNITNNTINNNNEITNGSDAVRKPEDLSAKPSKLSPAPSPLPSPAQSPVHSPQIASTPPHSSEEHDDNNDGADSNRNGNSMADCKDVLDNLLYKINNNNNSLGSTETPISIEAGSESDASCNSESHNQNSNDACEGSTHKLYNNNNNNSNKTDEEERANCAELQSEEEIEAIRHGEKFLNWLENCSNPRVTAMQLMQLRILITSIKTDNGIKSPCKEVTQLTQLNAHDVNEDSIEDSCNRNKIRRRK